MKFYFQDVQLEQLTTDVIRAKISEYDAWKFYCPSFKELKRQFCSELRKDRNPSCQIFAEGEKLWYKDHGTGDLCDVFNYVQKKYGCNLTESCNIIGADFGLIRTNTPSNRGIPTLHQKVSYKQSNSVLEPYFRAWRIDDVQYWEKYGISLEMLAQYGVTPCKFVLTDKMRIDDSLLSPIYCYSFNRGYKIYRPLADKYRWLNNSDKLVIQGYQQLPENGELLIITKSLKDVICYKILSFNAIAPQSESIELQEYIINHLKTRFKRIIINFDWDTCGITYTQKMNLQYNLPYFYIEETKDVSDLIAAKGIEYTKEYINKLINGNNTNC